MLKDEIWLGEFVGTTCNDNELHNYGFLLALCKSMSSLISEGSSMKNAVVEGKREEVNQGLRWIDL